MRVFTIVWCIFGILLGMAGLANGLFRLKRSEDSTFGPGDGVAGAMIIVLAVLALMGAL